MSLLHENHLIALPPDKPQKPEQKTCWEVLGCSKVLCPVHGKRVVECWLTPGTHCASHIQEDFFEKMASCLSCSYFAAQGRVHPSGWNRFIADQMHRYNIKALEHLYQKEESFVEILNRIPDGLFTTDHESRITYFNPAAEKITGFSAYDAVGMYCKDVFKNPICETDCAVKRAIRENQDVHNREYVISNISGQAIPIICSTSVFRDESDRIIGGLEIFKDITHRKRTEEEVRQRNRELSILNSIALALNHNVGLNQILQETLKNVLKVLHLKRGAVIMLDQAQKKAGIHVSRGLPGSDLQSQNPFSFRDPLLGKHLMEGEMDLSPEPNYPPFRVRYKTLNGRFSRWLTCFLITSKSKGIGFFALGLPAPRLLNQHEMHLLGSLGNFLGGAIENTRLMDTIRSHRRDLKRLTEKLFQSQEEERQRIARELHDEAGQSLTAVKLALERLEEKVSASNGGLKQEIGEIRFMIKRTSNEIRRLSYHLHPTLLVDLGLEPALNLYFKEIRNHSSLHIEFNMVGFDQRLNVELETILYRFSQEALTNALKHSGAESFRLSIIKSYPRIIFLAEDNGSGFDPRIIDRDKRSLGLLGMRERVSMLGGSFQLRSRPREGTRIRIEMPYTDALTYD